MKQRGGKSPEAESQGGLPTRKALLTRQMAVPALNMWKGQSIWYLQRVGPREILRAGERRLKIYPVHIQTHIPAHTHTETRHTHTLSLGPLEEHPEGSTVGS